MSRHPLKIVIAGAGIGGLAAAACLKAAGFEVELYERARARARSARRCR